MTDSPHSKESMPDDEPVIDEEGAQRFWRKIADDPELASKILKAVDGVIPDGLKRSVLNGVGSVLLNEDSLRATLSEKNLPKEAVGLLLGQADVMRKEILRIVSGEIRVFLENMDFGGEISKILTAISFEIKTEIRFVPNDQAFKPSIKNKVKMRRSDSSEAQDDSEASEESEPTPKDKPERPVKGRKRRWALLRKNAEGIEEDSSAEQDEPLEDE